MAKSTKYKIGVDVGGTKMLAGVLSPAGKVISSLKAKTVVEEGEQYFMDTLAELIRRALEEAKLTTADIDGIGIGSPGIIDAEKNFIISSPNIPFLSGFPLGKRVQKYFPVKVAVENDVNTGLYGEWQCGAAKGYKHVAGFFLGTGIGGALILDGKLYRGANGAAGEFGHICIEPGGPACGCGKNGCLEAISGRLAVAASAAAIASRGHASNLLAKAGTDIRNIKSGAMAKAIKAGDTKILELVQQRSRKLGQAMGMIVNALNPELIVLGGGMVEALGDIIVPEAEKAMHDHTVPALAGTVKVVPATLGDYAIVIGAAKMVADR